MLYFPTQSCTFSLLLLINNSRLNEYGSALELCTLYVFMNGTDMVCNIEIFYFSFFLHSTAPQISRRCDRSKRSDPRLPELFRQNVPIHLSKVKRKEGRLGDPIAFPPNKQECVPKRNGGGLVDCGWQLWTLSPLKGLQVQDLCGTQI